MKVLLAIGVFASPQRLYEKYTDFTLSPIHVSYDETDDMYHMIEVSQNGETRIGDPIDIPIIIDNGTIIFPKVQIMDYDICCDVMQFIASHLPPCPHINILGILRNN